MAAENESLFNFLNSMANSNYFQLNCNYATKRFYHAVLVANLTIVKSLWQEDVDVNVKNRNGFTPFLHACMDCRKRLAEMLFKAGANLDDKGAHGMTVLHLAARNGWTKLVSTLVKKVSYLDERDIRGQTAMFLASELGHLKIVKCLIEEGADADLKNCDSVPPLIIAAQFGRMDVVDLLLNSRANADGYEGMILFYASRVGFTKLVHSFVKRVTNLNECHEVGQTALHVASKYGHLETVKCLVEEGADINTRNRDEETALHLSSKNGHLEIVKYFVEEGSRINTKSFDLDAKNACGVTALGDACKSRKLDIARYLLQAGARWDIESADGNSPFNYVTRRKEREFIELFIESGAYLKPVDYKAIVKCPKLKVLQDVELCYLAIVNKYNNHDLPELYKTLTPGSLPCIKIIKIASNSKVAQVIKQSVRSEILAKGYCNVLKVRPIALSVFSVASVLEYRGKKENRTAISVEAASCIWPL